jgi:serine/threonine protein kinase
MFIPTSNAVIADRYELIEEIGRGGMGVIWRARQSNLAIDCAIKFIHETCASDPEVRRRFVREARAAASLKSPHSVNILDVDEWQGSLFIAMELLHGETLEQRLTREGRLGPELTLQIFDQLARGLVKAHAAHLVHRDLKPENIFLVDEDPLLVKILDFGIAKQLDIVTGAQTAVGALVGTPWYMSPEQALGHEHIDYHSDLWSLAVVAFRCLTGTLPFDGEGLGQILINILSEPIPAPSRYNLDLPPAVDEWWFLATQREPSARPPSVTALVTDLRRALESANEAVVVDDDAWLDGVDASAESRDGSEEPPATLEPVAVTQAPGTPTVVRYAVALVPALVFSGWVMGSRLWPGQAPPDAEHGGRVGAAARVEMVDAGAPRKATSSAARGGREHPLPLRGDLPGRAERR